MPELTPRQRLIERVTVRLKDEGFTKTAYSEAVMAVDAYYIENHDHPHHALVSLEVMQIMLNAVPSFVTGLRAAFDAVQQQIRVVHELGVMMAPYADMISKAKINPTEYPRYSPSGLPLTDGPYTTSIFGAVEPDPECDCSSRSVDLDGAVIHYDTCATNAADAAEETSLSDTGRIQISADQGHTWQNLPGVVSAEFGPEVTDADVERLEREHPTDRITGAPHHYIINGDHSACGCGGHLVECDTWDIALNAHAASICGISRTLCRHSPRHSYREICTDDAPDGLGIDTLRVIAGFTDGGEPVYGPTEP